MSQRGNLIMQVQRLSYELATLLAMTKITCTLTY